MTTKNENVHLQNDNVWSSWMNSFQFYEALTKKSFSNQKEWINSSHSELTKMEDASKKLASEWKSSAENALASSPGTTLLPSYSAWFNQLEEIAHKSHTLAFTPGKASLNMMSSATDQLETAVHNTIDQQRQQQTDAVKSMEGFFEQLKQVQSGFFQPFGLKSQS